MVKIITNRHESKKVSWQIVYEWEDAFVSSMHIPFLFKNETKKNVFEIIRYNKKVVRLLPPGSSADVKIIFQMAPPYEFNYFSSPNYLPIIIDVWRFDLARIAEFCKYNKWIFVGSLESVSVLKNMGIECVSYLPVSISNIYKHTDVPAKDIDLITYGRNHMVMYSWINKLKENPNLNIVHCAPDERGELCAWSSKTGYIGSVNERKALLSLIARSRYTAVSSPGNDEANLTDKQRTGGFSPVTPRFFEAAVNYSIGIGIFPDNPDYIHCKIKEAAIAVTTYEEFEDCVLRAPDYAYWKPKIDAFLELHWTDKRIEEVRQRINSIHHT